LFCFRSAAPGSEPTDGQAPVVGGARNPQQMAAQKRLQQTQAQVDEVIISIYSVDNFLENFLIKYIHHVI